MAKLLLAENDAVVATDLAWELEGLGMTIAGMTCTLAGALKAIQDYHLDFALLGVRLHEALSYPAARQLQTLRIPFAFLTSFDDVEIVSEFRSVPRLLKPQDPKKIAEFVMALANTDSLRSRTQLCVDSTSR